MHTVVIYTCTSVVLIWLIAICFDSNCKLLTELVSFLPLCEEATTARYWITFLVFSVFPAPDSPLGRG